jgi:hypothetical protein
MTMMFSGLVDAIDSMRRAAMRRPLVPLVSTVLLAGFIPAQAETFGRTTVGTIPSGGLRTDVKRGSQFTLAQNGTATSLCAFLDGGAAAAAGTEQGIRLAMYRDDHGVPGAKLAETEEIRVYGNFRPRWVCEDIGWTPLTAGAYWLVIHSGLAGSGPARYFYDGPANYFAGADSYLDGTSDPFGPGGTGNGTISIYANYTPGLQHAGRTTVGNTPSAPLRGDFKRGSSITFPQAGRVSALSAYLDAPTSFPTGQQIRLSLYDEVNGAPGNLVAESFDGGIRADTHGRWFTFPTPETIVNAGRYWLMLHTASYEGSGPARYFADGTPGNWLGNADLFGDGSSSPFGTAGAGNGTVSAYASYEPGLTAVKKFGYTKVGVSPQGFIGSPGGLGPSWNEGSRYRLTNPGGVTINGLYAYVDGLGGVSGTAQVRMAIYGHDSRFNFPGEALAVSSVVTIASGRQPGWVKFDIPATRLPQAGYYWMAVHVGPTAGIVRTYADVIGHSWWNGEADFSIAPAGFINRDGEIVPSGLTLSAYATYN